MPVPILNVGAGCWWMVNATPRPPYPLERALSIHFRGGWVGSRTRWTDVEER